MFIKEKESVVIASGKADEDMQSEFDINFNENYNEIEFTNGGLLLNGDEYKEVK